MKRILVILLPVVLAGAGVGLLTMLPRNEQNEQPAPQPPQQPRRSSNEAKAAAALEKVGAHLVRDSSRPGKPVVELTQSGAVDDQHMAHVADLEDLEKLVLHTMRVSDAGLEHVKWLKRLTFLQLDGAFDSIQPPMKGQSLTVYGFDKRFGKYTAWGIDTMGTYSVSADGTYDDATKTITLSGTNEEPGMGKVPFRFLLRLIDDTHYSLVLEMQFTGMGWQKQMEVMHEKM